MKTTTNKIQQDYEPILQNFRKKIQNEISMNISTPGTSPNVSGNIHTSAPDFSGKTSGENSITSPLFEDLAIFEEQKYDLCEGLLSTVRVKNFL